ncbi:hypothetical protein ISN45_Aa02g008390 [Arabidopsis thaliana x Arabidopsis arenosa]|uniref:Uncharacterized protein n=1 Tax=Arabidopsis thaliana x Arabidopsis arenosa TaxID=1240361 RepID=A0A8T2BF47_9BRAS|nr:hypothetical protein ISN45_Aa02g008390 [Arabidopsis thaliana x Arabidopsis arenosa]
MSSMNMIKITMMMALLLMGVRAMTVTQSQETDRKFDWASGMYWNPRMCYYICSGPCGKDNNCLQRCKKCCHWHCMDPC